MRRTIVACVIALAVGAAASRAAALLSGSGAHSRHAPRRREWRPLSRLAARDAGVEEDLDETNLFAVTVVTAPAATGELTTFAPAFSTYSAIVMNYDAPDERWPLSLKASFENYMKNGVGGWYRYMPPTTRSRDGPRSTR